MSSNTLRHMLTWREFRRVGPADSYTYEAYMGKKLIRDNLMYGYPIGWFVSIKRAGFYLDLING
jgi:hypothetical protein